jgi:hypothetical protein
VFVAKIGNELIMVLGILRAYDVVVDLKYTVLRLEEKEIVLWPRGTAIIISPYDSL